MTLQTKPLPSDRNHCVLLLVDIQPDFMPGGALGVEAGDEVLAPIRRLCEAGCFGLYVATQDWHPPGHVSFASSHAGHAPFDTIELYGHEQTLWPDHCVQGTVGAELHPALPQQPLAGIIRKGMDPRCDSYSAFRNNWDPREHRPATGLAGYLRERGIQTVFVCGLARDVCVQWSAEDAVSAGFSTFMLWDLTRAVDPGRDDQVRRELRDKDVEIIDSRQLEW